MLQKDSQSKLNWKYKKKEHLLEGQRKENSSLFPKNLKN